MARQHRNPGLRRQHFDSLLRLCQGPICQGCFWWFDDYEDLEVDHKNPKSAGGEDTLGNLTLLCSRCNKIKSNRLALPGLQDELKKDPEAMPQASDMATTKYMIGGRVFTADLKPTKALRDLLDEVSEHSHSAGRGAGFDEAIEKGNAALSALRRSSETIDIPVPTADLEADDDPTGIVPERLGLEDSTEQDTELPSTSEPEVDTPRSGTARTENDTEPKVAKQPLTLADISGPVSGRILAMLTLPDKEVGVNNWTELYVELARYLVRSGKLNRSLVPVKTSRGARYAVTDDGRHSNGRPFQQPRDIGNGLVLETNASAMTKLTLSKRLLEECGVSPSSVQLRMTDQPSDQHSGVTSRRSARTNRRKRGVRSVRDRVASDAVTATSDAIGPDGWKRLSDVEGDWHMAPPSRFKLAGRPVVVVKSWKQLYAGIAAGLVESGQLTRDICPIYVRKGRLSAINTQPYHPATERLPDGRSYEAPYDIGGGMWLENKASTIQLVNDVKNLLRLCGVAPDDVLLEFG